jgi:DNA helicase HerA-like ATPase
MSSPEITTYHIDYLQRTTFSLHYLAGDCRAVIQADPKMRRLKQVLGVGRAQKEYKAVPGQPLHLPSQDVLVGLSGNRTPIAFLVQGSAQGVTIQVGVWSASIQSNSQLTLDHKLSILEASLKSMYRTVELGDGAFPRAYEAGGLVIGVPAPKPADVSDPSLPIDRIIRALSDQWAILVLAHPVHEDLIRQLRDSTINEQRIIQQRPQAGQIANPLAEHYGELLKMRLKSLTIGQAIGMWRTMVYLLGTSMTYDRLASIWRGTLAGDESVVEPVNTYRSDQSICQLAAEWALPNPDPKEFYAREGRQPLSANIQHPYPYQTLLTSAQLAAYIHFPQIETSGFAIHTIPSFDVVPARRNSQEIAIGNVVRATTVTDAPYGLATKDLTRHAFVAGVTGAGKTNTILVLLQEARREGGIPYLVIEPAKTEYRILLHDEEVRQDLQVFTLGNETVAPYRMNPFEVPPQIPVSVHIDLLRSVFNASFGLWNPLPQILEQCLHKIYTDRGWNITTNTNYRGEMTAAAYPTLSDLIAEVDKYTQALGYSGEVTSNIRAALLTRLNSLRIGGKGRMLDVQQSFPMKALLERPTIMELESIGDDDDKAFVMGLLLIRLVEYWRSLGNSGGDIRHLLVIEEAHRLLANVVNTGRVEDASPRAQAVETFANILSEVRAYGQGIIIADQVPIKLARNVIKNTNLKIAHRVVDSEDRQVLAGAMAMTEEQAIRLATLPRGQAAVFSEGDDAPLLVKIRPATEQTGQESTVKNHSDLRKETNSPTTGQTQLWLDNTTIKAHMAQSAMFRQHRHLLQPHPGCTDTGEHAGLACQAAKRLAETTLFQRTFSQVTLTMIINPSLLEVGWANIKQFAQEQLETRAYVPMLLPCLIYHASRVFAHRRGAQGHWSFADTEMVQKALHQTLLDRLENRGWESGAVQFSEMMEQLYKRYLPSCAYCPQVYQTTSPACLYIYHVDDLIASGILETAWTQASVDDSYNADDRRIESAKVCGDAVLYLLDRGSPEQAKIDSGLCFAAAMLSRDDSKHLFTKQFILNQLIKDLDDLIRKEEMNDA